MAQNHPLEKDSSSWERSVYTAILSMASPGARTITVCWTSSPLSSPVVTGTTRAGSAMMHAPDTKPRYGQRSGGEKRQYCVVHVERSSRSGITWITRCSAPPATPALTPGASIITTCTSKGMQWTANLLRKDAHLYAPVLRAGFLGIALHQGLRPTEGFCLDPVFGDAL